MAETGGFTYTERKPDLKSRYFSMFETTFEKCLIQLSVELIQLDIVHDDSLNYTEYRVESALPRVESNIGKYLDLWSIFLSVYIYYLVNAQRNFQSVIPFLFVLYKKFLRN